MQGLPNPTWGLIRSAVRFGGSPSSSGTSAFWSVIPLLNFKNIDPGIYTVGLVEKVRRATGGLTENSPEIFGQPTWPKNTVVIRGVLHYIG